jgi:hypothetical protein
MALVMAVLCAVLYGRTVDFPMTYDDNGYLKDNPFFLRSGAFSYLASFREFATWPLREGVEPDLATNMLLRPLAYATLHWNHMLDGFEPRWFRVVNILIHALNGLLLFAVLRRLGAAMFITVVSALLFIVHPLAVESVTYIVQRFTSLGTLWVLLCLWLYFGSITAEGRSRSWLRGAAVVAALAGMLTKEDAVVVPLLAVGLDWLVLGTRLHTVLWRALPLLLTLPVVPGMVMAVSWAQHDGAWSLEQAVNLVNLRQRPWSHWQYAMTQWTVMVEYLRLLVWPSGQNLCHTWPVQDFGVRWGGAALGDGVAVSLLLVRIVVAAAPPVDGRAGEAGVCLCAVVLRDDLGVLRAGAAAGNDGGAPHLSPIHRHFGGTGLHAGTAAWEDPPGCRRAGGGDALRNGDARPQRGVAHGRLALGRHGIEKPGAAWSVAEPGQCPL